MARVLIVGCGCRGRELTCALAARGHAVRGTTRAPERLGAIAAAGAEAAFADPNRLGTLMEQLEGASALCWLMGTAHGPPDAVAALHGPRLASMLEAIVDTPVRGVVYEAAGTVAADLLELGAELVRDAAATHRMRAEILERDPGECHVWLRDAVRAVETVLGP